jgi:2,3-bisphosphoglycerate-independent phosphoglycerate mutase
MALKNTLTLLILDGFGHSTESEYNAVAQAHTPNIDYLKKNFPHNLINASENFVGLPSGQMGNSEVGHMNIGAGRVVYQDFQKINNSIKNHELDVNPILLESFQELKNNNGRLHLFGLLSDGGVHSHYSHFEAVLKIAKKNNISKTFIHAFLDGRDTPPKSADKYINSLELWMDQNKFGQFGSIAGRFFSMDRDLRWERIKQVYDMIINADCAYYSKSAISALMEAYARDETDEFVSPTLLSNDAILQENDMVLFINFRSDRGRELTQSIINKKFSGFDRKKTIENINFVTMTNYDQSLDQVKVLFPHTPLSNTLGSYISDNGLSQLRIAETEKYPHVTFFFNGGEEKPFKNEDRILIPSPDVHTYDLKPQMSVYEVTKRLTDSIYSGKYDVVICNFANGDMVGHTGIMDAAIKAVEAMDDCVGKIIESTKKMKGSLIVTADHGNAELMMDIKNNQKHTQHTTNLVPFIVMNENVNNIKSGGRLCDIAPTMLTLLGVKVPDEMTGEILVDLNQ